MSVTILHKYSNVAAKVPAAADLQQREILINTADGKLYTKKQDGTVLLINPTYTLPVITSVTIDLGDFPVSGETFDISDANASVGKKVLATISGDFPNGADIDDLELDPILVFGKVISNGVIRMTVVMSHPHAVCVGEKTINYYLG